LLLSLSCLSFPAFAAIYDVTLQSGVDFQKASEGLLAVINENKQKNTDTEAFHLGAYFDDLVKSRHSGGNGSAQLAEDRSPDVVPAKAGSYSRDWIPVFTGNPGFRPGSSPAPAPDPIRGSPE